MAGMIRKAFPSVVVPMSLRTMGPYSINLNHTISALKKQRYGSLYQSHSLSSIVGDKDLVSASLYKLLKHEMKSVKFNLNNSQMNKLPDSFPFKIVDEERGCNRFLVLERKFLEDDVETITVIINMRDVDRKEFDEAASDSEDDKTKNDIKAPAIPMVVRVGKPGIGIDDHLQFKISVSTEDINIQRFYICGRWDDFEDEDTDFDDDPIYFGLEGPNFKEYSSELQLSLYKYLEIRGIKTDIVSFLLKYTTMYNHKYNSIVLKDLAEFIRN